MCGRGDGVAGCLPPALRRPWPWLLGRRPTDASAATPRARPVAPPCVRRAVTLSATKDGVKFTTSGDVGTANVTVRQNASADKVGQEGSVCVCVYVWACSGSRGRLERLDLDPPPPFTRPTPCCASLPPPASQPEDQTRIDLKQPVALTFALRYLNSFAKATPLASHVTLSMGPELPIRVEYKVRANPPQLPGCPGALVTRTRTHTHARSLAHIPASRRPRAALRPPRTWPRRRRWRTWATFASTWPPRSRTTTTWRRAAMRPRDDEAPGGGACCVCAAAGGEGPGRRRSRARQIDGSAPRMPACAGEPGRGLVRTARALPLLRLVGVAGGARSVGRHVPGSL